MSNNIKINSKFDLLFERSTTLSVDKIWQGWTHPETLIKWFCPKPWKVSDCRIELRPGGEFYTLMEGPEGERMPNTGCYLEVVEKSKLVWTNLMRKDYQPNPIVSYGFPFVATISLSKIDKGTLYHAVVKHADEDGRKQHEQMGFEEGWGLAFDQLFELMKNT